MYTGSWQNLLRRTLKGMSGSIPCGAGLPVGIQYVQLQADWRSHDHTMGSCDHNTMDAPVGGLHPVGRIESTCCDVLSSVYVVLMEDISLYNAHLQYVWGFTRIMSILSMGREEYAHLEWQPASPEVSHHISHF